MSEGYKKFTKKYPTPDSAGIQLGSLKHALEEESGGSFKYEGENYNMSDSEIKNLKEGIEQLEEIIKKQEDISRKRHKPQEPLELRRVLPAGLGSGGGGRRKKSKRRKSKKRKSKKRKSKRKSKRRS